MAEKNPSFMEKYEFEYRDVSIRKNTHSILGLPRFRCGDKPKDLKLNCLSQIHTCQVLLRVKNISGCLGEKGVRTRQINITIVREAIFRTDEWFLFAGSGN